MITEQKLKSITTVSTKPWCFQCS